MITKQQKTQAFSIKHWNHKLCVQMCPSVKPDVTAGTTLEKFGSILFNWTLTTHVQPQSCGDTYLFTCDVVWKSTSSVMLLNESEGITAGNEWAESPQPSTVTDEPRHMTANTRHIRAELNPPGSDTLPGVFLCPVRTASPLPGCSQVVLLASSLLTEEGEIVQFSAALFHEHETDRNDWSRGPRWGNYLMKKTRPSRVTP